MNGQMKKYKESLEKTPGPVMPSQLPKVKLDMRGLVRYAIGNCETSSQS